MQRQRCMDQPPVAQPLTPPLCRRFGSNAMLKIKTLVCLMSLTAVFTHAMGSTLAPEPSSLDDYVRTADFIIVGNIANVDKIHNFYGYQPNAAERENYERNLFAQGKKTAFSMGIPLVDFNIHVQNTIKPDNKVEAAKSSFITYRKQIEGESIVAFVNGKDTTGRYVFFLNRNPDNKTYGIVSASREISVDAYGSALGYKVRAENKKVLGGQYEGQNFIQLLKERVSQLAPSQ